ncbi:hypothetical protein TNCV_4127791 [Trichonephila clavipes]|uniref:Uncharacterized protein n=1 Tax=Trichonephila clavipes TaxID=2585209 RepID=A0A8X6T1G5_TRICX|nr:hypothetical protein TNCV_4127791 [Trichonephila clavipes]
MFKCLAANPLVVAVRLHRYSGILSAAVERIFRFLNNPPGVDFNNSIFRCCCQRAGGVGWLGTLSTVYFE